MALNSAWYRDHFISDDTSGPWKDVPAEIFQWILDRTDIGGMSGLSFTVSFCSVCFFVWDHRYDGAGGMFPSALSSSYVGDVLGGGCFDGGHGGAGREKVSRASVIAAFIFSAAYQLWGRDICGNDKNAILEGKTHWVRERLNKQE